MDGLESWWEFVSERQDEVLTRTLEHADLVMRPVLAALILGVLAAVLAHRRPVFRGPFLGVASVLITVPSLALFGLFIPLVGIGNGPAYIALTMYALLPIMRNAVTGLGSVDPAVVEAARGMGVGSRQRLLRIELPLAWPVILAGLRVATQLTAGIAAIAVLVGGSGLGAYIDSGLGRYPLPTSTERVWTGTVLIVGLALVLDIVLALVGRLTTSSAIRR